MSKVIKEIPEGWDLHELGNLGVFSKGKGILKDQVEKAGIACIRYGEIYTSYNYIVKEFRSFISETVAKESKKINYGDLLFAGSGETIEEIGKCVAYLNHEEAFAGGDIIILSPNELVNPEYLSYLLETDFIKKQKRKLGQGNSVVHIYSSDLKSLIIPLPKLPEQKAVASSISSIENVINKLNHFISKKEFQKKALMQQLLTGKKRVKGFDKEWSSVRLRDVFGRVTRKNIKNSLNVVTISAQRGFVKQEDFFNKTIASDILTNYFLVKHGEFCYNKSYSNGYPWGATKRLNSFDEAVVTTLYICFKLINQDDNSGDFFEHYFESGALEKGLMKIAHEGGRAHGLLNVTPTDFFNLTINIPGFEEQTAIANILQTADQEIQLLKAKAEKLKAQKRGIMQQLLTGKKRLKPIEI